MGSGSGQDQEFPCRVVVVVVVVIVVVVILFFKMGISEENVPVLVPDSSEKCLF